MHLRELVEILGKPTGWRPAVDLGVENCVLLEWTQADGAVFCVMSTESESAVLIERAWLSGSSLRWITPGLELTVPEATDPRDNPIAVLAEFLE